ncbi:PilZ domain-containing protein [Henriciella barbarensis]|nr:PilZ domain-containing protein [Henriciella barbarensis]
MSEHSDKRDFPRFEVNTSGTLILQTGFKMNFVVKDMSQRGAKILLNKTSILPEAFTVEFVSPDRTKVKRCEARRQWQRGPLVGIRLLSAKTIRL